MKKHVLGFVLVALCLAFTVELQKRTIRENGYDIKCYIALKKINNFDVDKTYYWYKSGGIHKSVANIGGEVLHNEYLKYYRSNQLAEQGTYNYGLKNGLWKSWYENGQLSTLEHWNNGYLDGKIANYDSSGSITLKGEYNNNLKVGTWINYKTKDTSYYKKDLKFEEKPKNLLQRVLYKKDSIEKAQIKLEKVIKRRNDSIGKVKAKLKKKNEKRKDSIKRVTAKHNRKLKKQNDSIQRANKKKNKSVEEKTNSNTKDDGFFKTLFKKKK
ncbi:hypothetical protein Q4Q35_16280 [Flavivirga aquimarina]|uniref:Toxin-antitoxin system YwqK family antitoxin n=1 Tax=Flavivirga aquimarina TaxID=2027862 RepID=A0ABT8WDX6_9FLAO|nr:hypothetical protein [Flavivirga aquimarina]MDO5971365.1 hypothetical protein [Flavivirga aquimarina]